MLSSVNSNDLELIDIEWQQHFHQNRASGGLCNS